MLGLQSEIIHYCITSFLYHVWTHATLEYGECYLCRLDKHVEFHGVQPLIGVPSLICDILSVQKKYIIIFYDDIGVSPSVLTLSYIMKVGKNMADIMSNIYALVDESDLVFDGEILEIFLPQLVVASK